MTGAGADSYAISSWLFLRALALVYGAAFLSLGVQIRGLVGSRGVLPASDLLAAARRTPGARRYLLYPTIFWAGASDGVLVGSCAAGVVLAVALALGVAPVPVLIALWLLYLSLITVCDVFLGYQWDVLLVETGALAVWMAPLTVAPHSPAGLGPSALARGLLLWLLFRLMISSGAAKLLSGDPTWRRWTALQSHYETQPLPTPLAWFVHRLPPSIHRASVVLTLAVELGAPMLLVVPGIPREAAATAIAAFMVLIMLTGNYGFFNPLTIALCIPAFPDSTWRWWARRFCSSSGAPSSGLVAWVSAHTSRAADPLPSQEWPWWAVAPMAALILCLSLQTLGSLFGGVRLPAPLRRALGLLQPLRLVNGYGLFAVMTTTRREIVIEGSSDGPEWHALEPRWKPGDVRRRPRFTGLHMPRLDWQLWFAALGDPRWDPFLGALIEKLRAGSPPVLRLFRSDHSVHVQVAHRRMRVRMFQYRFTTPEERRATEAWWHREEIGIEDAYPGPGSALY